MQLSMVIAWSYYLSFMHMIPHWKNLSEDHRNRHNFLENGHAIFPKKCHLGPQNGSRSSGPKKLPKIVNCATIKETEKLKEIMVGVQV